MNNIVKDLNVLNLEIHKLYRNYSALAHLFQFQWTSFRYVNGAWSIFVKLRTALVSVGVLEPSGKNDFIGDADFAAQ